jgi:hypothetical protein
MFLTLHQLLFKLSYCTVAINVDFHHGGYYDEKYTYVEWD